MYYTPQQLILLQQLLSWWLQENDGQAIFTENGLIYEFIHSSKTILLTIDDEGKGSTSFPELRKQLVNLMNS